MFYERIVPTPLKSFLSHPTIEHLQTLLLEHTGETDFLDFKTDWIEITKLAKHILAIANSGGGCIIVGMFETSDGVIIPKGLTEKQILDKADVDNKLQHLLPKYLSYRTEDFSFNGQADPSLQGKTFQTLIIEYDPRYIPFTSIVTRGELRYGAIYVRQGTKSLEANNEKLIDIVLRKVHAGGTDTKEWSLTDHLHQLHLLYDELKQVDQTKEYKAYIQALIKRKKLRIEQYLGLFDQRK